MVRPPRSRKCQILKMSFILFFFVCFGALAGSVTFANDDMTLAIIRDNALFRTIYAQDPAKARKLALEAEAQIAAGHAGGASNGDLHLRYRGGDETTNSRQNAEDTILQKNRKEFDENPVLKELYRSSPLAALRMLKRLREATGKN